MLLGDRTLWVPSTDPEPRDLPEIEALNGRVWVEMDPHTPKVGRVLLSDGAAEELRPTSATVIGSAVSWLQLGERVLVDRMLGYWLSDVTIGDWEAIGQVRIYGDGTISDPDGVFYSAEEGVLAVMEESGIRPLRGMVLIKRDSASCATESGLVLPDNEHFRGFKATVVAAGEGYIENDKSSPDYEKFVPMPESIQPGARVAINVFNTVRDLANVAARYPNITDRFGGSPEDYELIHAKFIHAVLPTDTEE